MYVPHGYNTLPETVLLVGDNLLVMILELMLDLPPVPLCVFPDSVHDSSCCASD